MWNQLNASVESSPTLLERGIAALQDFIGQEAAYLLQPAPRQKGEAESFTFPLPDDYTGIERRVRISFPTHFPQAPLQLQVQPSPWLKWPHAMESGLCLHGFREKPVTGTPEEIVRDSLSRLSSILRLVAEGADPALRDTEFHNEYTTYWSLQLDSAPQDLLLLERPKTAAELFAISDPRPGRRNRTAWLASSKDLLKTRLKQVVGHAGKIRAPSAAGFYVKLQTHPDIRFPTPKALLDWLTPHLSADDAQQFLNWFSGKGSVADRWIMLELPGGQGAPVYCLEVRSYSKQPDHGRWHGFRSARRWSGKHQPAHAPVLVRATMLNILDREDILSRDLSGTASDLEKARVVMIGVGSLGSPVALQLAKSGVGELILIDPDVLESANLGRHVLGTDDLAQPKAEALAEKLRRDLPIVKVTPIQARSETVMQAKPSLITDADLVIVTTADWDSEVALWASKSNGAPRSLIQAWSEPHSYVGHALLAPDGNFDGRSLFDHSGNFLKKYTEWPQGEGVIQLPACGQTFIPGGASGMANVAAMVVQLALRSLTEKFEQPVWSTTIYRPQDITSRGGTYHGPEVAEGVQHIVLEREWPSIEGEGQ